jgi:pentose-5-phosphate-3-epimerase
MFLPSLLEYSTESLTHKLDLILGDFEQFNKLTKSNNTKKIHLHLDFVLPQFAKDRFVMKSLSTDSLFEVLQSKCADKKLVLSLHLMGDSEDLATIYNFFESYSFNSNWEYLFFVPEKYIDLWQNSEFGKHQNVESGIWLDLDQWQDHKLTAKNYLLMTVFAGKSGQKLTPEIQAKVLELVQKNPDKQFILDGGWSVDDTNYPENCQIVSYSSFWKTFEAL